MRQTQSAIIVVVIAMIAGLGGYQLQRYLQSEPSSETATKTTSQERLIGKTVEVFNLSDSNGNDRSFSEWQGNVVAINFWATWCPPCREEIPHFVELQDQYANQGLQFVGVALQQADEVQDFLAEFNVNYPSLVGDSEVIDLAKKLGNDIGALPYTVIVDRDSKIAFTKRGPLSKSEAESVIQSLL